MKPEIAFISGASRGVGRAIAVEFARAGISLAVNCRQSVEELERLAQEIRSKFHVPCVTLAGDVGDEGAQALPSQSCSLSKYGSAVHRKL